jgi:hypothetical protein
MAFMARPMDGSERVLQDEGSLNRECPWMGTFPSF